METDRQRAQRAHSLGLEDLFNELIEICQEDICTVCNEEIEKNLSPTNPTCEGRWCAEATEIWLDKDEEEG